MEGNMKKCRELIVKLSFCLLLLLYFSCGGSGGDGVVSSSFSGSSQGLQSDEIIISGSFTGGIHAEKSWLIKALNMVLGKAFALDPVRVAKVIVIGPDKSVKTNKGWGLQYKWTIAYVINGSFWVSVKRLTPVGMIFVGDSNEYLSYLSLKNGLTAIPVNLIDESISEIDLGKLSSSGIIITPSKDPFDNEIKMTLNELRSFSQISSLFSSIVKNPDVDGNGVIDFLEGKNYFMEIIYTFDGGTLSANLTGSME